MAVAPRVGLAHRESPNARALARLILRRSGGRASVSRCRRLQSLSARTRNHERIRALKTQLVPRERSLGGHRGYGLVVLVAVAGGRSSGFSWYMMVSFARWRI
jgi:hypothetical protein